MKQSQDCAPREMPKENPLLLEMQQGNFTKPLQVLEAMQRLTESGAYTSYHTPPSVILSALRLVTDYIESPIGKCLVTIESPSFLRLYEALASCLLEVRADYNNCMTVTDQQSVRNVCTGSPAEESLMDKSKNLVTSESMKDTFAQIEVHREQEPSSTMSEDLEIGGSTTEATSSPERSGQSGDQAEQPSATNSENSTEIGSTDSWRRRAVRAFLDRLRFEGHLTANEIDEESILENTAGNVIRVDQAMSRTKYQTWVTLTVKEGEGVKTIHTLVDGRVNFLEHGGATNDQNDNIGFDENDRRPMKVIKFENTAKTYDIRFVDAECYWYVKTQRLGEAIHNHSLAQIKTLIMQHLKQTKCAHVDANIYYNVVKHTAFAIMIPTEEDVSMIDTIAKSDNIRKIEKYNEFVKEGTVQKKKGWCFPTKKRVQVVSKQ
jgi:hypothetical protein